MDRIKTITRQFISDEEGIAATEYALLLGLIALGLWIVIGIFGDDLNSYWNHVNTSIFDIS